MPSILDLRVVFSRILVDESSRLWIRRRIYDVSILLASLNLPSWLIFGGGVCGIVAVERWGRSGGSFLEIGFQSLELPILRASGQGSSKMHLAPRCEVLK